MKFRDIKDKGFWFIWIVYILAMIGDLWSTLQSKGLVKYLETNPLYDFGGLSLLVLLNVLVIILWAWLYKSKRTTVNLRFLIMMVLIVVIFTRVSIIDSNLQVAANPPTVAQAMAITKVEKTTAYVEMIKTLIIPPIIPSLLTYLFFKFDHKIKRKGEKDEHENTMELCSKEDKE